MSADPAGVRAVYDRNAVAFDARRRGSRMETGWISRFAGLLPDGAEVLDLGCGSGEPVARLLLDAGFRVTGADFSRAMLGIARQTFPCAEWIEADMRDLALGRTFDGIVAWHSIFHLTVEEQRAALPRIAAHLRPGVARRRERRTARLVRTVSTTPASMRRTTVASSRGRACRSPISSLTIRRPAGPIF
jgi:2-polyprenyl-3-methyl-5-hydroxy-6-metoxy-1,4-benzoquinol methylase